MKSHKRRAVLAIVIAVSALVLQEQAMAAKPPRHAAKGAADAAATEGAATSAAAPVTAGGAGTAAAGPPALSLTPATLSFAAEAGRAAPSAQSVSVSGGGPAVSYSVSSSSTGGWLRVKPGSGKTPDSISISADPAGLSVGTYSGTVIVASSDAANSPMPLAITLTVAPPALMLAPTTLSFTAQAGGVAPAEQSVTTSSSNGTAIGYSLAASSTQGWLSVKPATSTTPSAIRISANPAGLSPGTYSGTVVVDSSGASNGPLPLAVTFTVTPAPTFALAPELLTFSAKGGEKPPAAQTIKTSSSGAAIGYSVTASSTGGWLSATSASGTTPGPISVTANQAGLAAGTYTGTVTVTSSDGSKSEQVVGVAFTVTPADLPTLAVAPASLAFVGQAGGISPASQTVVTGSSGATINYTVSAVSRGNWLSAATSNTGATPDSIKITANPSGLAAGTYTGTVILTSSDAANASQTVEASFTVTAATLPTFALLPATLSFTAHTGDVSQGSQIITINSSGTNNSSSAPIHYTASTASASWLHATPASGSAPGSINISVAPAGLAAGTYTGAVTVDAQGVANSPQAVFVTLNVSSRPVPKLAVNPTSMSFTAQAGGKPPAGQTIAMVSTGAALGFKVTTGSSAAWLFATPADGLTPGSITISVNPSGLAAGTYHGSVSIAANEAGNSPQIVPVTLVVTPAGNRNPTAGLTITPDYLMAIAVSELFHPGAGQLSRPIGGQTRAADAVIRVLSPEPNGQGAVHLLAQSPSNHAARICVQDSSKKCKLLLQTEERQIGHQQLVDICEFQILGQISARPGTGDRSW